MSLSRVKRRVPLLCLVAGIGAVFAATCRSATTSAAPAAASTTSAPVAAPTAMTMATSAAPPDSFAAGRERVVSGMLQRIAGKEKAPAESVFQNIKTLKGIPAGQLLTIMNESFGHGLGVSCSFCHVPGQWASDQKPNKDVAREMVAMVGRLNTDLKSIRNLPDSNPMMGCITCHRVQQKPVLINPSR